MMDFEQDIEIEIERLVFRNITLSPERAQQIRRLVKQALARLLAQDEGVLPYLEESEVMHLEARYDLSAYEDDNQLATQMARRIVSSFAATTNGRKPR